MTSGQEVISSPVSTAFIPKVCRSMKGMATKAIILAVKETMLVSTDIEKTGIRSRSNGSIGYWRCSWVRT